MPLKKLFVIAAVSSLIGCAAPEFPSGRFCTLVWDQDLEHSYGYCVKNDNVEDFEIVSSEKLFKEKYVAEHPDYFMAILDWKDQMIRWAKEKWRNR